MESRRLRMLADFVDSTGIPAELVFPDGSVHRSGQGEPAFRVTVHDESALTDGLDELALGTAYVEGKLNFEGDLVRMFDVRSRLAGHTPPVVARIAFLLQLLSKVTSMNKKAVSFHYDLGDDFYLTFLDGRHRLYSQGHFHTETESIEEASEQKLATIFETLQLKPGMRLLDIGAGWGGATKYCADRGVHVTSLTIADDSYKHVSELVRELPNTDVRQQDFLEHRPDAPYDAIVILGVIEHIPNYRQFAEQVSRCLVPGGRMYLDASASREKHDLSAFTRQYIWNGPHTFMAVQDLVEELLFHGLEVLEVKNESRDYELTMRQWAERFDAAKEQIVAGWGEEVYRAFRIYLWGGCHALGTDGLQAYRVVARRGPQRGPRPGLLRRTKNFALSLRG